MTVNEIIQIINSVGFPIVMCGALFWRDITQGKQRAGENKAMTEAINNNTLAVTKLSEKIDKEGSR